MSPNVNSLGQPVGAPLPRWKAPPWPPRKPMEGRYCRLEPLDPRRHAKDLYAANSLDKDGRSWTYLPYGSFGSFAKYRAWMAKFCTGKDPQFFAVVPKSPKTPADAGKAAGVVSYLRIAPTNGSIEVGHIHYSPSLQKTPAATEAMFLLMQRAFALGYRRYEWKCDALNTPSRAAALRLGLSFEGIFRQATVYKERNRDTAWYAALDGEWPALERAFLKWLEPGNFDPHGRQRASLSSFRAPR